MQSAPELLTVSDGGIQTVPTDDFAASPQIVYLDFEGVVTSYVNADLGIAIGGITVEPSGFGEDDTAAIAATLNGIFDDVVFTTEIPTDGEFSTIYVGVTSAFDEYGDFLGLAETIDSGNQIRDDNAFVLLDSSAPAELVVSVIAHEMEHIVHGMEHGGEGLDRFAADAAIDVGYGQTNLGAQVDNIRMDVHNGGLAVNPQVYNGGVMNVYDVGKVGLGAVALNGVVNVYNNGSVGGMVAGTGGVIKVYNNGIVASSLLVEGGVMNVYDGGLASSVTVSRSSNYNGVGGVMSVYNGGVASDTTVNSGGRMWCYAYGVASDTTVNSGGSMMCLYYGCVASNTTVNSGGSMWCYAYSVASNTTVNNGFFHVYGLANSTTVNSGGKMWCYGGGLASNTTVNSGLFEVGGVANNTTVNTGSILHVGWKGKLTGRTTFRDGAQVEAMEGSILDFDISNTSPSDSALVNNLSVVMDAPFSYTLTVSDTQEGVYRLADGAAGFDRTLTVFTASGETLGTITVGDSNVSFGKQIYSLAVSGGQLLITVAPDITPPDAPVATADTTAPTNQDVTVTANFSDDSAKKQYSLDNNEWLDYEQGVVMADNGTVWFRSMDAAGNVSEVTSYEVMNIDKEPPAEPSFRMSGDSASREVILSARWDEEDARCFYELDGGELNEYDGPLRFSGDACVHFQTQDAAGNKTDCRLELMLAGIPTGVWGDNYFARNCSVAGVGLEPLKGRNIIGEVCNGSDDTTILLLTDDGNGDALFLDDIYSAAPDIVTVARLSQVNQIVAGAGDDIIDLTSARFDYANNGIISVLGGDGDDVIWANNDSSLLLGDAGDDRIVGGNGNDVIAGGAGNDILHGGGGGDIFCFGGSWGDDTVEQLEGGSMLLWFDGVERENLLPLSADAAGNAVLSCEAGSVTLLGVKHDVVLNAFNAGGNILSDNIFLQFGDSGLDEQYKESAEMLRSTGAFNEFSSDRIYDDREMLA